MKNLNKTATRIFCQLLEKANNNFHQFETTGFMPLILSHVSPLHGSTGKHTGELYELAHTFVQEGDTMHDPLMGFMVMGYSKDCDPLQVIICPISFRQDTTGFYQESVKFKETAFAGYFPALQADQTYFANKWLRNLKMQGFLQ